MKNLIAITAILALASSTTVNAKKDRHTNRLHKKNQRKLERHLRRGQIEQIDNLTKKRINQRINNNNKTNKRNGYDRLQHVVLSQLSDSVKSMVDKGWKVDVYLVLGYKSLASDRRQMIQNALPNGVGLEVWEDAIPYHYEKTYNYKHPRDDQTLKIADHALSRQHRFVLRDKLPFYDFFACFVSTI